MRRLSWVATILASLCATSISAFAADADDPQAGGYFGNLHAGARIYLDNVAGTDVSVPYVNVGGKVAYDSTDSNWGWQLDGDYDHNELSWVRPTLGVDGKLYIVDTAAHLTNRISADSKLGVYAGYGVLGGEIYGLGGARVDAAALGVEGLTTLSDSTWIQGRLGLFDPLYIEAGGVGSSVDVLGDYVGLTAGGSLHHAFSSNFSAKLLGNYTYISTPLGVSSSIVTAEASANYTFSDVPLSIGVRSGYQNVDVASLSDGGWTVGSSLTYSFGGPSTGSTGKLFSSGIIGVSH